MTVFFHTCNGVDLYARRQGDYSKPPIVFSNSLGTDVRIWDAVIPALLQSYFVLTYDTRGHGASEAPDGPSTIEDHAADLLALLDAFAIDRCALVGLSVGGMIAQALAASQPDRIASLVLCDTAAKIGEPDAWNARIDAVTTDGLPAIAPTILERWFTDDYRGSRPTAMRGWHAMLTRQPANGYVATCAAIRDADLGAATATIQVPTLVLVGDQDRSTPPDLVRQTAALINGARFETIAGAGHLPCIEQPDEVARMVSRHVAETFA